MMAILAPGGGDAHPPGGTQLSVPDEHVSPAGVPGDEVRGVRDEGDVAAVGGDRRLRAVLVPLAPSRGDADPLGGIESQVAHEHVPIAVRVPGHQVRGVRGEGDVAAVVVYRRFEARVLALLPGRGDAYPLSGPERSVAHEHVQIAVRVP